MKTLQSPSSRMNQKGAYSILTGFVFIIIAITLILGTIYYQVFITDLENTAKDDLDLYELAKDARNKVFYCYGSVIHEEKWNESCEIPLIEGYKIQIINRSVCSNATYESTNISHYSHRFTYAVPVKHDEYTCLGKLEIFI
jgi:hypothetical protein